MLHAQADAHNELLYDADQPGVFTLTGFVRTPDGQPLSYATVRTQNDRFTITDEDGYYEIRLPLNQVRTMIWIEVRFVGMQTYREDSSAIQAPPHTFRRESTAQPPIILLREGPPPTARQSEDKFLPLHP